MAIPTPDDPAVEPHPFRVIKPDAPTATLTRAIAVERPVALEFSGIGYAVLMATPADLDDLAVGFALTERLIDTFADIVAIDVFSAEHGDIVRVQLIPDRFDRLTERVRHRTSESSCGMCGLENLDQAMRPLPRAARADDVEDAALFRALDALYPVQRLNRATGAVHAAAACSQGGAIDLVREDVGRHNAFDKLIGAMLRSGRGWEGGFALLSSRCSYELVEKAVLAGCPLLATISAPTSLALSRAREAGLALRVLARSDAILSPLGAGAPI